MKPVPTDDARAWVDPDEAVKVAALREAWRAGWQLPPPMTLPVWADTYRRLAPESGAIAGLWLTSRVEIARGPMLAVTEPGVHTVTVMTCTQLLKTSLLENIIGYYAHLDPCPILLVEPKDEAAEQYSKERITPFIRVTPVLANLIGTTKRRNSKETLLYKAFPGGFLAMAGAGSPDNLARRPVRVVLCDEVDRYPVTREGDPIALAEERTATFGVNWLSVRAGSPTVEDESRIEKCWLDSDQRRASLACPHCGHRLFPEFFRHVQWDKEAGQHLPATARIYCEACGAGWTEGERLMALDTARWHQTRAFLCCGRLHVPLDLYEQRWRTDESVTAAEDTWDWWTGDRHAVYRAKCPECGRWGVDNAHAGFHARKLYSPWQKDRPADIAAKWLAAKDDEDLKQTWWNTQEGLPYRPHAGKELRLEALQSRGEVWGAPVPEGVGALTAGLDVQDDRIECEIVGWGRNEESWSIDYSVFDGDPESPELWDRVDTHLKRIWVRADGRPFALLAACIDSGHCTQKVYEFARARLGRHIWATKGESARNGTRSPVWPVKKPTRKNKGAFRPVILGVNAAKDTIRARLHIAEAGAGYMHFPADRDLGYFAQLTAEVPEVKITAGHRFRIWVLPRGKANEALDCRVYAYAALCGLFHFGLHLNRRTEALAVPPENPVPVTVMVEQVATRPAADALSGTAEPAEPVTAKPAPVKPAAGPAVRTTATPGRRSIASRLA